MREKNKKTTKVKSGIPGLDAILKGGLIKDSISLIAGYSGAGKTLFGLQFIKEGLESGGSCIYISLKRDINGTIKEYDLPGKDWNKYLNNKKLLLIDFKPDTISKILILLKKISVANTRLLIDDFPPVYNPKDKKTVKDTKNLVDIIRGKGITTVFTCGIYREEKYFGLSESILPPLVDNIFLIKSSESSAGIADLFYIIKSLYMKDKKARKIETGDHGLKIGKYFIEDENNTPGSKDKIKISFCVFYEGMEKQVAEFNKKHDDMEVTLKPAFHAYSSIVNNVRDKKGNVDIAALQYSYLIRLAKEDLLLNLEGYYDNNIFHKTALDACTIDNKIYGMPDDVSCKCLLYRKDLLVKYGIKVPSDWNDLIDIAKYILKKEKNPGLSGLYLPVLGRGSMSEMYFEFLWTFGGNIYNNDGNVSLTEKKAISALMFMKDLTYKHKIIFDARREKWYGAYNEYFKRNKIIFYIEYPGLYMDIYNSDPALRERTGLAPLPGINGNTFIKTTKGTAYLIPKNTKYPEKSVKFIKYLKERSRDFIIKGPGFPFSAQKQHLEDKIILEKHPYYSEADKILKGCWMPDITIKNYDYIKVIATKILYQVMNNEMDPIKGLESIAVQAEKNKNRKMHSGVIEMVMAYLNKNYEKNITLNEVAKEIGISSSYLSSVFTYEAEVNMFVLLTKIRLEKAKIFLQDPRLNVSEAGRKAGYNDNAHFSKIFKKHFQVSPGEYKSKSQ
ncbi:MAG TPA: hypothetical protein DCP51_00570 [Clostridiales bacterium]|nr:hypothetical protein [Clostridiales bacterium]